MILIATDGTSKSKILKEKIIKYLESNIFKKEFLYRDFGNASTPNLAPIYAHRVAKTIFKNNEKRGILIASNPNTMAIAANKFQHIKACICWSVEISETSKKYLDCDILCLASENIGLSINLEIVKKWITTLYKSSKNELECIYLINQLYIPL